MGRYLQLIGRIAFRHPWRVLGGWLIVLAVFGLLATQLIKPTSSAIAIPGTDAQKAIDRAGVLFKGAGGGTGKIVFKAVGDTRIDTHQRTVAQTLSRVEKVDGIEKVISPFVDISFISRDGKVAYAHVQLEQTAGAVEATTLNRVNDIVAETRSSELQVELGGDLISRAPGEIIGVGEVGGVFIALMVLILTFGSLVAAGMPLVSALVAVGVSMAGLFSLSQVFEISNTTPVLAVMLGLAVGIDYSLFIINKYRSYLLGGYGYEEAAIKALSTAGNAVVFAALTVVIALSALSVVNIPFMTTMGLVGAASIAISALVAITLTPALLRLAGKRVFGIKQRQAVERAQSMTRRRKTAIDRKGFWYKWGNVLVRRPFIALVLGLTTIAVIAWPVRDLTLGLPTDQYAAKDSTQRKAYDILADSFGVGFNAPLTVVVEGLPKVGKNERNFIRSAAIDEFENQVAVAKQSQQQEVQKLIQAANTPAKQQALQQQIAAIEKETARQKKEALAAIDKNIETYARLVQLKKVADEIAKQKNVSKALPAVATKDGSAGIVQVIPESAPADAKTQALIDSLRSPATQKHVSGSDKVTFAVTGSVALQNDINKKLADALPVYLGVVVGLSLALLILAFRSVLVPIKATLGFLLSVFAMLGAIVVIFQWGWGGLAEAPGPIVSFIPIIATGILFGLAMDYEFFLVSGIHEAYTHGKPAKAAVIEGFGLGSKVVSAAAVIMVSVFGGFITNHDVTIQSIGFGLAVGILVDAFIVRMTITPALMALLGRAAWWLPKWIDKRLPNISIEGDDTL